MVLEGVWRYLMDTNSGDRNPSWGTIRMTDDCMGNDIVETNRYGANTRYDFTDIYGRANSACSLVWSLISYMDLFFCLLFSVPFVINQQMYADNCSV